MLKVRYSAVRDPHVPSSMSGFMVQSLPLEWTGEVRSIEINTVKLDITAIDDACGARKIREGDAGRFGQGRLRCLSHWSQLSSISASSNRRLVHTTYSLPPKSVDKAQITALNAWQKIQCNRCCFAT